MKKKLKINYSGFNPSEAEQRYLLFRFKEVEESYPEVVVCNINIQWSSKENYQIRMSGKYIKLDFTIKNGGPILLICINKIMSFYDEKLTMIRRRHRLATPININRSTTFFNDNSLKTLRSM